jgi:3D-(3,5/4)-trihydroxycyclohexane-1,2-dione acylhydrolase (decyclizing)
MAAPEREIYVMVGDGSYLMMAQEISTAMQEGFKLNIVLLDNHGFASIGGLSRACGNQGMGTEYRYRENGKLQGTRIEIDFVANAASLGARALRVNTREELEQALLEARQQPRTTVVVVETDYGQRVSGYESWWDVPVAEVSEVESVRATYQEYSEARKREKYFL